MRTFTRREGLLVYTAVLSAIVFGGLRLVIMPVNARYTEVKSGLLLAAGEKERMNDRIGMMDRVEGGIKKQETRFYEIQKMISPVTGGAEAETKVLNYLEECKIRPEKTRVKEAGEKTLGSDTFVYAVQIEVHGAGGWEDFCRLFDLLGKEPSVAIKSFSLEEIDENGLNGDNEAAAVMELEVYMLSIEQPPGRAWGGEGKAGS